jgi:hypothetical protein
MLLTFWCYRSLRSDSGTRETKPRPERGTYNGHSLRYAWLLNCREFACAAQLTAAGMTGHDMGWFPIKRNHLREFADIQAV